MNLIKLFAITTLAALLSTAIIACALPNTETQDINNDIPGTPPPLPDWRQEIESGGEMYADLRYKIEDGAIIIIRYEGEGGMVSIPPEIEEMPVTTIGIHAFREIKLTGVVIPDSVTSIGACAFYGNQLASVIIPDSVTSIGACAFYGNQLTSVVIPDSVTSIGKGAFQDNMLTEVIIPENIETIGDGAFRKNQLASVVIPDSVRSIGEYAFADNMLIEVAIPEGITYLENSVFRNNKLTNIIIPGSVIYIGIAVFDFEQITCISIGANVNINGFNIKIIDVYDFTETDYLDLSFKNAYDNGGKQAGTYTRPDTSSHVWTRQ